MYTTTADRAFADMLREVQDAEHQDTYGTTVPREARKTVRRVILALVAVAAVLAVVVALVGQAWDVEECRMILASFSGPTDHPAAVRCANLIK